MTVVTFDTSADASEALRADAICKKIGAALVRHYPGRQWYVDVSIKGGVVKIQNPALSRQYGFVLKLHHSTVQLEREAIRAAGQILEMFKLSRERDARGGEELLLRDARGDALYAATGL